MSNSRSLKATKCVSDDSIDVIEGDVEVKAEDLQNNAPAPSLSDPELLRRVLTRITPDRRSVLTMSMHGSAATGVPPYVQQLQLMTSAIETCQATLARVTEQTDRLKQNISDAFRARPRTNNPITQTGRPHDSGQVTREEIVTILDDFFNGLRSDIQTHFATLNSRRVGIHQPVQVVSNHSVQLPGQQNAATASTIYSYEGRFWDVPDGFVFPVGIQRDEGWKLWFHGMPTYTRVGENGKMIHSAIKPFRDLATRRLPKKLADSYKLHWKPIFRLMEEGIPAQDIPQNMPSSEVLDKLYVTATEYLKTRVSYIFDPNNKFKHNTWTLSTWSKYVGRSMILQRGSASDIALVPEENRFNRSRPGRKRHAEDTQQQQKSARQRQASVVPGDEKRAIGTDVQS